MSSLLFSSDLLAQGDPTRLASRSQAERRVVDRGRVSTAFTAISPSDEAPQVGSEPAAVVLSRTDQTPNNVVVLSNPRVGLDQSPFGRAPGHRAGFDATRTTAHFAAASAASAPQGFASANPTSIPATPATGDAPADTGIRPMILAPSAPRGPGGGGFFSLNEVSGDGDTTPTITYDGSNTGPFVDIIGGRGTVSVSPPGRLHHKSRPE